MYTLTGIAGVHLTVCKILLPYPDLIQLALTGNMGMPGKVCKVLQSFIFPKENFGDFNEYFQ